MERKSQAWQVRLNCRDGSRSTMSGALNLYGDSLLRTIPGHGADISSQRMEKLDAEALQWAQELYEETR